MDDLARYGDPLSFCRLDDLTVATLLNTETAKQLRDRWPVEFDKKGRVRAVRLRSQSVKY